MSASEFFEHDPSEESEEDLEASALKAIRSAFVTGSDWTTETLLSQMRRGNIDVSPSFQRREVWDPVRKSRFIESILLNLPIPQIVLAERRDAKNAYIVLDGKQRLLAIRQFCANPESHAEDAAFDNLRLRGLDVLKELNHSTYQDLHRSAESGNLAAFDNHTIRTVVVRNWPDDDFLYRVFLRLNTGSVPLSTQELRQALVPGPFVEFADQYAAGSRSIQSALRIEAPDFRMRDTEILVRFFGFRWYADEYRGDLKKFLDSTCANLNDAWPAEAERIKQDAEACDAAIDATVSIFGDREAFSRWRDGAYDRRFNRAIFDIMTYYLSNGEVRQAALGRSGDVQHAFESICTDDVDFFNSLSSTTKSARATAYRFTAWADRLSATLGLDVSAPARFVEVIEADR